ncbi:unnamed protein product [Moneuplotes crassus]|uniref:Uncharacterized protein n=1 Tax=Euplotes crassus TaxID=5936 RepID=A0AAD2DC15_EUPCR|nr:unnamed protein product [Moneuplotes crassus]
MFSPLGFGTGKRKNLLTKDSKNQELNSLLGSLPRPRRLPCKSRNSSKLGFLTARGNQSKHLSPMTLEEARRCRNKDSKFTDTLLDSMSTPLAPRTNATAMNFWTHKKADISKIETQIQEDKELISQQQGILKQIRELEKKHKVKVPYKLYHTLDMTLIKRYFKKIQRKKQLHQMVVTIQSYVRGWLQRKRYAQHLSNKLRLAIKVQHTWKRHHQRIKTKKEEAKAYLAKVIRIQSFFRGFLTRKSWDIMMKERLSSNEKFFETLKDRVKEDAAVTIQTVWRNLVVRLRKMKSILKLLKRRKIRIIIDKWRKHLVKEKKTRLQKSLYGTNSNSGNQERRRSSVFDNTAGTKFFKRKKRGRDMVENRTLKPTIPKSKAKRMNKINSSRMKNENQIIKEDKSDSDISREDKQSEGNMSNSDGGSSANQQLSDGHKDRSEQFCAHAGEQPGIFIENMDEDYTKSQDCGTHGEIPLSGYKNDQPMQVSSSMVMATSPGLKYSFPRPNQDGPKPQGRDRVNNLK